MRLSKLALLTLSLLIASCKNSKSVSDGAGDATTTADKKNELTELAVSDSAQLNALKVEMKLNRKAYMSGEHVYATVVLHNRGESPVRLHHQNEINWLDFAVQRAEGEQVPMVNTVLFEACQIPVGQHLERKVTLTQLYPLVKTGNYTIRARVRKSNGTSVVQSSPLSFSVFKGVELYRRQHAVKANGGEIVEYRLKKLVNDEETSLYFQSYDPKRKRTLATYSVGTYTGLHDVQTKIDGNGYLHALYPIDSKLFRYLNITDSGNILNQRLVKHPFSGQPMLATIANGKVIVRNGVAYKPKNLEAIHSISQRPAFSSH